MKKKETNDLRLNLGARLCPLFDKTSIGLYPTADLDEMGFIVQDNCAEEHIM